MYFLFSWVYLASLGWSFPFIAFCRAGFVDRYCLAAYSSVSWNFMSENLYFQHCLWYRYQNLISHLLCLTFWIPFLAFCGWCMSLYSYLDFAYLDFSIYRIHSVCIFLLLLFYFSNLELFIFISFTVCLFFSWLFRIFLKDLFIPLHCFLCFLGYL